MNKIGLIEELEENTVVEFETEPIPGVGLIFRYKGIFVISDTVLFTIVPLTRGGGMSYNITKEQFLEHLGDN